jgi:hypothetical protein
VTFSINIMRRIEEMAEAGDKDAIALLESFDRTLAQIPKSPLLTEEDYRRGLAALMLGDIGWLTTPIPQQVHQQRNNSQPGPDVPHGLADHGGGYDDGTAEDDEGDGHG